MKSAFCSVMPAMLRAFTVVICAWVEPPGPTILRWRGAVRSFRFSSAALAELTTLSMAALLAMNFTSVPLTLAVTIGIEAVMVTGSVAISLILHPAKAGSGQIHKMGDSQRTKIRCRSNTADNSIVDT